MRNATAASGLVAGLLALGACSSVPPPNDALATADMAVRKAEATDAPRQAPVELQTARDKLTEAQKAMVAEDYVKARRLAVQAAADAEYAEARATAAQAAQNRQQVDSTIDAIKTQPAPATP